MRARILLLPSLLIGVAAAAQMHRVEQPRKVTRAVAVYEWVGPLAKPESARLVPVSIFLNGRMHDGGTYLAQPVPLALEAGNVYAVQKAGVPLGTLEIEQARDVATARDVTDDNPEGVWYGFGLFTPQARIKASKPKPSGQLARLDDAAVEPLKRNDDTADKAKHPKHKHRHHHEQPQASVTGLPLAADDPDRPVLERERPVATPVAQLDGLPAEMEQAVAVSDPSVPEPEDFARAWASPEEEAATRQAMEALAETEVRGYLQRNGLVVAATAEDGPHAPPRLERTPHGVPQLSTSATESAVSQPLKLREVSLKAYELSEGDLPTFVYSARLEVAPARAQTETLTVYAVVVAQRQPGGRLQASLASVTDAAHLDRQPWMRLIDVVDSDGTHRGSLLFELRAAHSRRFALYGLTSAAAQQTFATTVLE